MSIILIGFFVLLYYAIRFIVILVDAYQDKSPTYAERIRCMVEENLDVLEYFHLHPEELKGKSDEEIFHILSNKIEKLQSKFTKRKLSIQHKSTS